MSQILEGATKHYGMSVLMTDTFYDMLPPTVQRLCRCVDKVKTPAIKVPMDLWTYDLTGFGVEQGRLPFPPYTTEAFRAQFDAGFKCYTEGDWREARSILESCLQLMPDDRPTQQLLQVMEKSNFQVPVTWKGFRETDSNSLEIQAQDDDKLAREIPS
ncbi:hypothetical protein T484DRAFT_1767623 [Baffinella frigidus]|nr:hypothetical protein T484DRAFT_1767623 [Cryptophyta sp. CCMP2293]